MITSLDELRTDLQALVSLASGIPLARVILADQGRPPPEPSTDLFVSYLPVPVRAVGAARKSRSLTPGTDFDAAAVGANWEDFEELTISQLELIVSCNFVNEGARNAAARLQSSQFRAPVNERLFTSNLAWRFTSEVRDLTAVDQAGLQPRFQLDIQMYAEVSITDTVLRANSAILTIEDEAGNVIHSGEFQ